MSIHGTLTDVFEITETNCFRFSICLVYSSVPYFAIFSAVVTLLLHDLFFEDRHYPNDPTLIMYLHSINQSILSYLSVGHTKIKNNFFSIFSIG